MSKELKDVTGIDTMNLYYKDCFMYSYLIFVLAIPQGNSEIFRRE